MTMFLAGQPSHVTASRVMPCRSMTVSQLQISKQVIVGPSCAGQSHSGSGSSGPTSAIRALLRSACRAAFHAQMQLAVAEQQLTQVERFSGDVQWHYLEVLKLVRKYFLH